MKKISILGTGAWGTALAYVFASEETQVVMWSKNEAVIREIQQSKQNTKYSGSKKLRGIEATSHIQNAVGHADIIINAIPSKAMYEILTQIKPYVTTHTLFVNAAKGIDMHTHKLPYEVFYDVFPTTSYYATLSGPSFAHGLLTDQPTTITLGGKQNDKIQELQLLARKKHVYLSLSNDIIGVEWGGIYKNIVSIAAGLSLGLDYSENTHAFVTSVGFREMIMSGVAMGANTETFFQSSGVGDLMLSSFSKKSRNFSLGFHLAKTNTIEEIFTALSGVAEGYFTLQSISHIKNKYTLFLPLATMLEQIIFHHSDQRKTFLDFLEMNNR